MHGLEIDANAVEAASLIGIAQCSAGLTQAHSIGELKEETTMITSRLKDSTSRVTSREPSR